MAEPENEIRRVVMSWFFDGKSEEGLMDYERGRVSGVVGELAATFRPQADALQAYLDLTPRVMTALMATKGRNDLLLANEVHRASDPLRKAINPTKEQK